MLGLTPTPAPNPTRSTQTPGPRPKPPPPLIPTTDVGTEGDAKTVGDANADNEAAADSDMDRHIRKYCRRRRQKDAPMPGAGTYADATDTNTETGADDDLGADGKLGRSGPRPSVAEVGQP